MAEFPRRQLYNACKPLQPATRQQYVDCIAVRGKGSLTSQFLEDLELTDEYLCFLFSGHVGSGKSSEIRHLVETLVRDVPRQDRYLPVLLDAREYFNEYDVAPTDILLAVVAELAATFQAQGIKLRQGYFEKRLDELKSVLFSDIAVDKVAIDLGRIKTEIKLLQKNDIARKAVRDHLAPHVGSVGTELKLLMIEARGQLKRHKPNDGGSTFHDFVIILDNLEKIRKMDGLKEGDDSLRELFIQRAHQLNDLSAHIIYTVPLSLVRTHGPALSANYGRSPFVLPMIKVEKRGSHEPYPPGWDHMRRLLERRVHGLGPLDAVILPDAQEAAIRYCGGNTRKLIEFVQAACTYVDDLPLTEESVVEAAAQTLAHFSASLRPTDYELLARLDASPDAQIDNHDADFRRLLEGVAIMEYINGGGEGRIESSKPWYAVNPVIREISQFKSAREKLEEEDGTREPED